MDINSIVLDVRVQALKATLILSENVAVGSRRSAIVADLSESIVELKRLHAMIPEEGLSAHYEDLGHNIFEFEKTVKSFLALTGIGLGSRSRREGLALTANTILVCILSNVAGSPQRFTSTLPYDLTVEVSTLSSQSAIYGDQFLEICSIDDGWPSLYVVGSFDKKKTISTQQIRAGLLSEAITRNYDSARDKVAIVGAGFSGITATSYLLSKGFDVTLFEQSEHYFPLQRDCSDRIVHPNIYEWPFDSFRESSFEICGLQWSAGPVNRTVSSLTDRFLEIATAPESRFTPHLSTKVQNINCSDAEGIDGRYALIGSNARVYGGFDVVIFCVGFGREPNNVLGLESRGYWESSRIPSGRGTPERPEVVLISGKGDSGLIEILHACLGDFRQSNIFDLLPRLDDDAVLKKLRVIENDARVEVTVKNRHFNFFNAYDSMASDWTWCREIRKLRNESRNVHYNVRPPGFFSIDSSPLNRFLVYICIKENLVVPKYFDLDRDMISAVTRDGFTRFEVRWPDSDVPESYDKVVLRHGLPGNYFLTNFGSLNMNVKRTEEIMSRVNFIDSAPDELMRFIQGVAY